MKCISVLFVFFSLCTFSQENSAILCSDGIDNDNDGRIDCLDFGCINLPNEGCSICGSGLGFVDKVIEYNSGCDFSDSNPEGAIGLSDFWGFNGDEPEFVFLGDGGYIKLGFTNNVLTNSGDSQKDLFVFEVGPSVEPLSVYLKPMDINTENILANSGLLDLDQDGYYFISDLGGALSSLDIDAFIPGIDPMQLFFEAVMLVDIEDNGCGSNLPGADIDAVCAIFSIDCLGLESGQVYLDECGNCLEPTDPNFNIECQDCHGVPNGMAVVDECGNCLEPTDPNFNTECQDCHGVPNGTAILDECGICLEPYDPNFNLLCFKCETYVPNVFSPNSDDENSKFKIYGCNEINLYIIESCIFDRWGNTVFTLNNYYINSKENIGWNGKQDGIEILSGVYTYFFKVLKQDNTIEFLTGSILLIR